MKRKLKTFIQKKLLKQNSSQQIQAAIKSLKSGKLVAIPTETVYGLAAPLNNLEQVKKIFTLKQRPLFDPLIVHVNSIQMAKALTTEWTPVHDFLASFFWPGPLTLLAPKSYLVDDLITSGLPMVGLRVPQNPLTLKLIKKIQTPLPAPSANLFKRTSPSRPQHVRSFFSKDDVHILNGGACKIGIESTIVSVDFNKNENKIGIQIHRQGMISATAITSLLRKKFSSSWHIHVNLPSTNLQDKTLGTLPGTMEEHYRPVCPFLLFSTQKSFLEWKDQATSYLINKQFLPLNISSNPNIASRQIYQAFHSVQNTKNQSPVLFLVLENLLPSKVFFIINKIYDSQKVPNNLLLNDILPTVPMSDRIEIEGWLAVIDRLYKASTKNSFSLLQQ